MALTDEQKLAAQAAYAEATRSCDIDAMTELIEPDAVVWHNYDGVEVTSAHSNRILRWLHRTVPDVAWNDIAVMSTAEGFVWQTLLTGAAPGGPLRAHLCVVVSLSDAGKVRRTDEYLDAAALRPLAPA